MLVYVVLFRVVVYLLSIGLVDQSQHTGTVKTRSADPRAPMSRASPYVLTENKNRPSLETIFALTIRLLLIFVE